MISTNTENGRLTSLWLTDNELREFIRMIKAAHRIFDLKEGCFLDEAVRVLNIIINSKDEV